MPKGGAPLLPPLSTPAVLTRREGDSSVIWDCQRSEQAADRGARTGSLGHLVMSQSGRQNSVIVSSRANRNLRSQCHVTLKVVYFKVAHAKRPRGVLSRRCLSSKLRRRGLTGASIDPRCRRDMQNALLLSSFPGTPCSNFVLLSTRYGIPVIPIPVWATRKSNYSISPAPRPATIASQPTYLWMPMPIKIRGCICFIARLYIDRPTSCLTRNLPPQDEMN